VAREDRPLDPHRRQETLELVDAVWLILVARAVRGVPVVHAVICDAPEPVAEALELLPPCLRARAHPVQEHQRLPLALLDVVDVGVLQLDPGHRKPPRFYSRPRHREMGHDPRPSTPALTFLPSPPGRG